MEELWVMTTLDYHSSNRRPWPLLATAVARGTALLISGGNRHNERTLFESVHAQGQSALGTENLYALLRLMNCCAFAHGSMQVRYGFTT